MRIIDLLNKIANGEEVPERIKYKNRIFKKYLNHNCYIREDVICDEYLLDMSKFYDNDRDFYNDEVELIEEDKKIEKIIINGLGNIEEKLRDGLTIVLPTKKDEISHIAYKINELIDAVNELKGGVDNGNN